jgi:spore maturation protein CgeB
MNAFAALGTIDVLPLDTGARVGDAATYWERIRWKLRWPKDALSENERLLAACERERPDIVIVDNSRVIDRHTLRRLRVVGGLRLVYYTPDDIMGRHNLSRPLKRSLREWDLVFTTKTFNVPELQSVGVRRPILVGKAYDPVMHRPLAKSVVGDDYERFDVVFIGTYESDRAIGINAIAESGYSVVVYGSDKGGWKKDVLHPAIELRRSVFGHAYTVAWHTGRVALCFLRKLNRDRITQRTMEIAAMGRPMLAEHTDEHDAHFVNGYEYLGFSTNTELIEGVAGLLADDARRHSMMTAIKARCETSQYSTTARARQMLDHIQAL